MKKKKYFPDTNICGGIPEGGKGQCSGDSGGPLLVDGVQVGIVSWSVRNSEKFLEAQSVEIVDSQEKPCTIAPYPGVYTGVSHYLDWIQKHSGIDFKLSMYLRARS